MLRSAFGPSTGPTGTEGKLDPEAIKKLEAAGLPTAPEDISVGVPTEAGQLSTRDGASVVVESATGKLLVELKPLTALFVGTRQPPPMRGEPPAEYLAFFHTIEFTAAKACEARGRPEADGEFARLYRHLRRRPDGTDPNPVFGCLQSAARMYLSLRDVSCAEYEAVIDRLHRSARTFHTHVGSTNYYTHALRPLLGLL